MSVGLHGHAPRYFRYALAHAEPRQTRLGSGFGGRFWSTGSSAAPDATFATTPSLADKPQLVRRGARGRKTTRYHLEGADNRLKLRRHVSLLRGRSRHHSHGLWHSPGFATCQPGVSSVRAYEPPYGAARQEARVAKGGSRLWLTTARVWSLACVHHDLRCGAMPAGWESTAGGGAVTHRGAQSTWGGPPRPRGGQPLCREAQRGPRGCGPTQGGRGGGGGGGQGAEGLWARHIAPARRRGAPGAGRRRHVHFECSASREAGYPCATARQTIQPAEIPPVARSPLLVLCCDP